MDDLVIPALGREWHWPRQDNKCRAVVFDTTKDLQQSYIWCRRFDTVVQAGGNMGVWPWALAQRFRRVFTFEADPRCFPYLVKNLEGVKNVTAQHLALLDRAAEVTIVNDAKELDNLGAQYVVPMAGGVKAITIDSLDLDACDLIYLDIEGAEFSALQGAVETIKEFKPVIAVEDKGLSKRFGTEKGHIETWLADFGYKVVARPHRDVILKCA